jgi:hypothetical protein
MLPVRLTLRNFLAYRAPDPVILDGLHLACLSGPNGAGKSSLLDAITWALWGRARARSDQELISLGTDDMSVELDFEQENERYRVTRQRDRKRRQGQLSLFIWDEKVSGGFNEISASTMRETQARINDLLRLDYDTFVHSAFLQQGKADVFTVKTPAQRKQILGDILGLDSWRYYEDRAKRQLREIDTALGNIDGRLTSPHWNAIWPKQKPNTPPLKKPCAKRKPATKIFRMPRRSFAPPPTGWPILPGGCANMKAMNRRYLRKASASASASAATGRSSPSVKPSRKASPRWKPPAAPMNP